jgi:hypothetical protein
MCIGCTKHGIFWYEENIKQAMVDIVLNKEWHSKEMIDLRNSLLKEEDLNKRYFWNDIKKEDLNRRYFLICDKSDGIFELVKELAYNKINVDKNK